MAGKRSDTALCGLAGEFLAAGQLLKRGLLVSVTMGNAKAVDLLVYNEKTGKHFGVQVKTMRGNPSGFFMERANKDHIYVFVRLNDQSEPEHYFVVKGSTLVADSPLFFGTKYDA
jgi:hypothetical protein